MHGMIYLKLALISVVVTDSSSLGQWFSTSFLLLILRHGTSIFATQLMREDSCVCIPWKILMFLNQEDIYILSTLKLFFFRFSLAWQFWICFNQFNWNWEQHEWMNAWIFHSHLIFSMTHDRHHARCLFDQPKIESCDVFIVVYTIFAWTSGFFLLDIALFSCKSFVDIVNIVQMMMIICQNLTIWLFKNIFQLLYRSNLSSSSVSSCCFKDLKLKASWFVVDIFTCNKMPPSAGLEN